MNTTVSSEQNSQDFLNALLLFVNALSLILKEDQGIVVDVKGDVKLENTKKVIIYKQHEQIHITKCDDDLPEGSIIQF